MNWLQRYPKEIQALLLASLINSTGSALMWPLTTMYVFGELGRSMQDAGLVILLQSLGGIAGQLVGGAMYHRIGVKKLLVGSLMINALSLFALPVVSGHWHIYMLTMLIVGFSNAMTLPAIQGFIGFRFASRRGEIFNTIYVGNNIGVALGTALSGVLASISFSLTFILNGVTCLLFAVYFFVYLNRVDREGGLQVEAKTSKRSQGAIPLLMNTRVYLYMGLGALFLWLGNCIWNGGVSPTILSEGRPPSDYSLLWTMNGILIFALQPLISWIKRTFASVPEMQMTAGSLFYLAGYAVILLLPTYWALVLAMFLATIGEMLFQPAMPAFISERTQANAPFYLGVSGGIGQAGRVIGPYIMGVLYDRGGLQPVAWLAVAAAVLSCGFFVLHHKLQHSAPAGKDVMGEA
ncbi:MFS transporter [Saccharibacillus kuerlensis]|uniref:MFS-type transporter YttB n=1 Tax=Saccharibacillus kuerlensis TaxID=459527 RepID=A0ABQ2KUD6_9BACL|nr:MFS transporter [Saccharibacillus kuerlensis]GGN93495.1 putative MFS-type transporter YttB [Saccharibacillus kuerlensis]